MKLRLLLAYDGTNFKGFAKNPGVRTVAGVLEEALQAILGTKIQITCAGRTDAGVHARGQVVSIQAVSPMPVVAATSPGAPRAATSPGALPVVAPAPASATPVPAPATLAPAAPVSSTTAPVPSPLAKLDIGKLHHTLNKMCGAEIAILEAQLLPDEFNARIQARSRTYRYSICNSVVANPFATRFSWHIPEPLDVTAMQEASQHILGVHDFSSFCRQPGGKNLVRRVITADWLKLDASQTWHSSSPAPPALTPAPAVSVSPASAPVSPVAPLPSFVEFQISASAFCHQMVRSLVGTLTLIGLGKYPPHAMQEVLASQNRQGAGNIAPPHGLCLWSVDYAPAPL